MTLLNVQEASDELKVPESWLYRWHCEKKFPPGVALKIGKYLRFDREKLLAWVMNEETGVVE